MKMGTRRGFTLIELLVVIAILAAFGAVGQIHSTYAAGGSIFGIPTDLDQVFDLLEK